ncbi:hypothetical protein Bbelb_041640 [Branchiostoma belcheri]|nr:hypothetical protein Bbelb_041640 [Branchiostoma belcheri]
MCNSLRDVTASGQGSAARVGCCDQQVTVNLSRAPCHVDLAKYAVTSLQKTRGKPRVRPSRLDAVGKCPTADLKEQKTRSSRHRQVSPGKIRIQPDKTCRK